MPSYPASAIDQTGNLHDGELALSRFIVQGDGGLYVNRSLLDSARDFSDFVDRIFGSGLYFRGLDYARLQSLLYDEGLRSGDERDETVFLAADITLFRPQRQPLYKALSIASSEASYLFEPLYFEGEADPELIESTESRRQALRPDGHQASETRLYLDVDEFVASAWRQGVRFGIDVAVVREGIGLDKAERRVVARSRPCVAGTNAELIEEAPSLRRNNAPRRLLDDRVDLCRFVTRYPQVTASLRLLRKIPCTPGVDGCDIAGNPLPAPRPEDLQLDHLAGPGTHVEREAGGEYLVASVGGFLNVDSRSKRLSVADKIVSHEGVSVRTTGDLLLTGEVYEQYGEIQEKRIVQCRTITAHADVFGNILSSGGVVRLKSNLVGGSASNDDGDIFVDGRASGATLIAQHGCITVKQADNCVILAREVVIEQATNCSIVAEEVRVRICEASAMAARTLRVGSARSRRDLDSVLLLLVPDLSPYQAEIATLENKRSVLDSTIAGERARIDTLRSEPEVARYLLLAGKLRCGPAPPRPGRSGSGTGRRAAGAPAPCRWRGIRRGSLPPPWCAWRPEALAQQAEHLAVGAAALALVLVEDDVVEGVAEDLGLLADVLVAPVAGAADDHAAALRPASPRRRAPARGWRPGCGRSRRSAWRRGSLKTLKRPGAVSASLAKGPARRARRPVEAERPGGGDRGHGVLDLEADGALARQRHRRDSGMRCTTELSARRRRCGRRRRRPRACPGAVRGHHRMVAVGGEEGHRAGQFSAIFATIGSAALSTAMPSGATFCTMTRFSREVFHRGDVVQAEVVALADVGHHGHLAAVEARPSRSRPPRAVSSTAASTSGCISTLRALFGPLQSPLSMRRPPTYTPSVLVMPTRRPCLGQQVGDQAHGGGLAVGAGHRHHRDAAVVAGGNSRSTTASPTARPLPKEGARCMRRPGAAFTSTMPPPCSSSGLQHVSQTTSTPQMSRPIICAAADGARRQSGCTSSVTSVAVPPVDRLALLRSTDALALAAARCRRSGPAAARRAARCRRSGSG
jgi:hypothetical protein